VALPVCWVCKSLVVAGAVACCMMLSSNRHIRSRFRSVVGSKQQAAGWTMIRWAKARLHCMQPAISSAGFIWLVSGEIRVKAGEKMK